MPKEIDFICPRFFTELYTSNNGLWAPCCYSKISNYSVYEYSISDWYNSNLLKELRKGNKELFNTYCSYCINLEKNGILSPRKKLLKNKDIKKFNIKRPKFMPKIKFFNDICNLSCIMCKPANSILRKKDLNIVNEYNRYFPDDGNCNKHIDYSSDIINLIKEDKIYAIKLTGGEPSIIPAVKNFLNEIKKYTSNIDLQIQTNMMEIERLEPFFKYFKKVYLQASIDRIGKPNEYLRKYSNWGKIVGNIDKYKNVNNIEISIEPCLTLFNINYIEEFREFCLSKDIRLDLDNILHDPSFLSYKNLPQELNKSEYKSAGNDTKFIEAIEYIMKIDKIYNHSIKTYYDGYYKYYKHLKER